MVKGIKRRRDPLLVVFSIFLAVLVLFFVVIMVKIFFSPICAADAAYNVCVVDIGSISGLASTFFGIAATVLTFLGAFAVAYWWANLDEKIASQVEEQTTALIEQRLQDQEKKFQDQIAANVTLFDEQIAKSVETFDVRIAQLEATFQEQLELDAKNLDDQVNTLTGSFQFIRKELVIAAMLFPVWQVENWAEELLLIDPSSEVSFRMVMSYLDEVDYFLPDPSKPSKWKTIRITPDDWNVLYCWSKALEWQQKVLHQNNPGYLSAAAYNIEQRRERVEAYEKQKKNDA